MAVTVYIHSFVPFVVEATGRFHTDTAKFIISKYADDDFKDPLRVLHSRCAVIIQKYNAKMTAHLRAKTVRT